MKLFEFQIRNPGSTRGAALVIALAIMVLVMALILGFLSRIKTEQIAAHGYASSVSAKILAENATQIIQAQIDAAAKQGTTVAWTSQPGLIRTFNANGAALKGYKLYSSPTMQVNGALVPSIEAAALTNWYNSPALFTDINMPVDTNFDGTPDEWPILDPAAIGKVEGFAVTGAPSGKFQGITNTVPMPVSWIYILQDGQMVAPSGAGNTVTVTGASASNPIIGRIAFWTDDETCKVNVNTASEGTYWDVPRAYTSNEKDLGTYQPAKNEFQAYPGHPASVSLSTVFPDLSRDQIMALTPRIQNGGSKNATVNVDNAKTVTLDQDRLYATDDELLFANSRTGNAGLNKSLIERGKFFLTTTSRAPETNLFNLPKIVCWPIHETNTTDYRTPFDRLIAFCGTLNNFPYYFQRKNSDSTHADYDEITRNQKLIRYLHTLAGQPIPGFGGNFAGKFGADRDQILAEIFDYIRCTNLADGTLSQTRRYSAGTLVNGTAGGYFGSGQVMPIEIKDTSVSPNIDARGFGRVPTLTEVGLWIICNADAKDTTSNNPVTNKALYPADASGTLTFNDPLRTKQLRIEAALVLEPFIPLEGYKGIQPDIQITISGLENWKIKGNASGDSDQSLGFPSLAEQTFTDKGVLLLTINPLATSNTQRPYAGHVGIYTTLGLKGLRARNHGRLTQDPLFTTPYRGGSLLNQQYPFVGEPLTVNVDSTSNSSPSLTLTATPIEIKFIQRSTGTVLQTFTIDFPSGAMPSPTLQNVKGKTFQATGDGISGAGRFSDVDGFTFQNYDTNSVLADIEKSVVPVYDRAGSRQSGDFRLLAMKSSIASSEFYKHPLYDDANVGFRAANSFTQQSWGWYWHFCRRQADNATAVAKMGKSLANMAQVYSQQDHPDTTWPVVDAQTNGDWDNGVADDLDGPYLNKPDEGVTYTQGGARIPYFSSSQKEDFDSATFFSPNRMIPSPGMFGSLPTGVKRNRHWETLLFRRQPGHSNYSAAAGRFTNDPDYLMLDLFWMPVVEPYAISEPLSTAGKINLNQQIIPFTWVERNTGIQAVLKSEKVIAIPNTEALVYKSAGTSNYRFPVDIPSTLKQLQFRFTNSDGTGLYAFRSASEICDFHIVPSDPSATISSTSKTSLDTSMATYWANHALTGDNSRERVYTTIYPRLTTKSNTYTVYFRAQSLKPTNRTANPDQWTEGKGLVTGEYRGSTTLERYLDPNNTSIPDYASDPGATPSLDSFYHWRLRAHRQFAP